MITVGELLDKAQRVFWANWGGILACELVAALLFLALLGLGMLGVFTAVSALGHSGLRLLAGLIVSAALAPVAVFVELGFYQVLLDATRGEPVRVGRLFSAWRQLAAGIAAHGFFQVGQQLATMACLLPGLWFYAAFGLTKLFVVDRELEPVSALRASLQATRGQRWLVLRAGLVQLLLLFVGALCCGVGLLVTYPLAFLLLVAVYESLEPALESCPLCQEAIPPTSPRCPGCDEWEPLRAARYTRCQHCASRVPRAATTCPFCAEPEPVPPEKAGDAAEPWQIHVPPGPPTPRWVTALVLALLVPALAWTDDPVEAGQALIDIVRQLGTFPWWLGLSVFGGVFLVPTLGAFLLAAHQEALRGGCDVDQVGVRLGRTPTWRGVAVPWSEVRGFRLRGEGVRLALARRSPLARLFEPTVRTRDRQTHELVERLEARGLRNLDG